MEFKEFNEILEERFTKTRRTLCDKAVEYAGNGDRLHNFNSAARILNTLPEEALWGMMAKHLVSVSDMVNGVLEPSVPLIDEKIGDTINYLILLEAIFKERYKV